MAEQPPSPQQQRWLVVERPRISAAAVLLLILIFMNAISLFAAISYWSRVQDLKDEISLLRSEIRTLAGQIEVLNEHVKIYRSIDKLIELYVKQMVIKTYKELFPEMSEEEIEKLLESVISEETEKATEEEVSKTQEQGGMKVVVKG